MFVQSLELKAELLGRFRFAAFARGQIVWRNIAQRWWRAAVSTSAFYEERDILQVAKDNKSMHKTLEERKQEVSPEKARGILNVFLGYARELARERVEPTA